MVKVNRTVIVTGATGFIGKHLVERLSEHGYKVILLVRSTSVLETKLSDRIIRVDVDGTVEQLTNLFKNTKPMMVLHLASLYLPTHQPDDVQKLVASNISFPSLLLEAMKLSGIKKFLNTGTSWQHYNNEKYEPVNLYAATKQSFEDILQYFVCAEDFSSITLKLFDTYGPADKRKKLFHLLKDSTQNTSVLEMSPGEQLLNIVYIDDVIDAFVSAVALLEQGPQYRNESFAVSADDNEIISLRELVRLYSDVTGTTPNIKFGARPYRAREVMVPWTKGTRVPNWKPKTSLRDGIRLVTELK